MNPFDEKLTKYAELVVEVGVNIQKGQTFIINATITAKQFVRKVAQKVYEARAKNVQVFWSDEVLTRMKYEMAPLEAFQEFP